VAGDAVQPCASGIGVVSPALATVLERGGERLADKVHAVLGVERATDGEREELRGMWLVEPRDVVGGQRQGCVESAGMVSGRRPRRRCCDHGRPTSTSLPDGVMTAGGDGRPALVVAAV
jgi:hypothetical protein